MESCIIIRSVTHVRKLSSSRSGAGQFLDNEGQLVRTDATIPICVTDSPYLLDRSWRDANNRSAAVRNAGYASSRINTLKIPVCSSVKMNFGPGTWCIANAIFGLIVRCDTSDRFVRDDEGRCNRRCSNNNRNVLAYADHAATYKWVVALKKISTFQAAHHLPCNQHHLAALALSY